MIAIQIRPDGQHMAYHNGWKSVRAAKNLNPEEIPENLTLGCIPVAACDAANSIAEHFDERIKCNVNMAMADINGVYSGKCKLIETVQYVDQVDL